MIKWVLNRRAQNKLSAQATTEEHDVLFNASTLLKMQMLGSDIKKLKPHSFFNSNFTRGYILGFLGAAMEWSGKTPENLNDFAILIYLGHSYLFNADVLQAKKFTKVSLDLLAQKEEEFNAASAIGFDEYMAVVSKNGDAFSLLRHLQNYK